MSPATICALLLSVWVLLGVSSVTAQERVTPKAAQGGKPEGQPWADVPDAYRNLKIPDWPVPTDLEKWRTTDRAKTRDILLKCLGDLPARPDPAKVKVTAKEEHDGYALERFEFSNGVDATVPGVLLIPKERKGPAPTIVLLHGHGSSKETLCINENESQCVGPMLVKKGFLVAAIDTYFCGDRVGKGPAGKPEGKGAEEPTLFKLNLWLGRTLWGMMVRDQQCLLDYLCTRTEVDKEHIGASGMSMGCTGSWWLAALDDRVKAIVGVVCFTRYTELIAHGNMKAHGIYYYVPGLLTHFDTEAIYALSAPRPMLMLSGDQDGGAPTNGIEVLEKKLGQMYRLYNKADQFRSVVYKNTGHEYLPEMKGEMVMWFEKYLPVEK
ncbi:MAG TPA: alpha/beta hydrolase family protein [Gemmataceae bacterium]|jgi:dienelactone hydrolase